MTTPTSELLSRLRDRASWLHGCSKDAAMEGDHAGADAYLERAKEIDEAAARLTELEAEVSRLREREKVLGEALRPAAKLAAQLWSDVSDDVVLISGLGDDPAEITAGDLRRARRAAAALAP